MILLSFRVRNHKSIRDDIVLDLIHPSLDTLQPRDADWHPASFRIAGIFGGNATGKSAILDALGYTFSAILQSSTAWQSHRGVMRAPFRLDGTEKTSTSTYELDFVHEGKRHLYGFEVDTRGIKREWLRYIPTVRWKSLLERDRDQNVLNVKSGGGVDVTERELVLSRALLLNHPVLAPIARDLVDHFDIVLVKDAHRESRLRDIADSLAEGSITFDDLKTLLKVADVGVAAVDLEESDMPQHIFEAIQRFNRDVLRDPETISEEVDDENADDLTGLDHDLLELVVRRLVFTHQGSVDDCPKFSVHDESDGTIAWLAVGVPALEALRKGSLLCIDEIDASLHPHLLELLLEAFNNPSINTAQAQLIFTSHESYILSPLSDVTLEPEQVWFTDKTYDGATELTCLSDFPRHPDANVAKRYLTGRYGGTPRLAPSVFEALITSGMD